MPPNPLDPHSSPPPTSISLLTLPITGLLVDIYGLANLPATANSISCLWLHHPRSRRKEDMASFARAAVSAFNSSPSSQRNPDKGLIALVYDQRNHGSRLVDEKSNGAWREGNERHAQDMFGVIAGGVGDQEGLIGAVGGYLFCDEEDGGEEKRRKIEQHLVLGVSLGGHSVWQSMFLDERIRAGVAVIGCPDFEYLMRERARLSKLATYTKDDGATFVGSKDFPPALVEACKKLDPKGILFGAGPIPAPGETSEAEQRRLRAILDERVKGKKFLVCHGGDDKLVPYRCSKPFLDWFKDATTTWYGDGGVYVEDNVYEGVGHSFSPAMVEDALRFVVDVVAGDETETRNSEGEAKTSKI
ncbi:hypothetical protein GE09DRAFT_1269574 [Coniochaeta sp. 2T2.1]|nr:hypothetical protein GE09DRAFT_1269574 [Coniochaeta sp. 2T2.1]